MNSSTILDFNLFPKMIMGSMSPMTLWNWRLQGTNGMWRTRQEWIKYPNDKYWVNEVNKENVKGLWTVSSSASQDTSLKVRAKARLESRALPTNNSYDEYMVERTSCWILEEVNGDFYCDCREGSNGKFCKHSIGMLYVTGGLVAEPDVRSVPLGNKRKRGRPKKNPEGRGRGRNLRSSKVLQASGAEKATEKETMVEPRRRLLRSNNKWYFTILTNKLLCMSFDLNLKIISVCVSVCRSTYKKTIPHNQKFRCHWILIFVKAQAKVKALIY